MDALLQVRRIGHRVFIQDVDFSEPIGHKLFIQCLLSFQDFLQNVLFPLLAVLLQEHLLLNLRLLRACGLVRRCLSLWLRLVEGWLKNALKSLERLISCIEYAFLVKQGQSSSDVPAECLGKWRLFLRILSVLGSTSIGLTQQLFLLVLWLGWHPEFGREDRAASLPNLLVFTCRCYSTLVLSPHLLLDEIVQC